MRMMFARLSQAMRTWRPSRAASRSKPQQPSRGVPRLEPLEDRLVLNAPYSFAALPLPPGTGTHNFAETGQATSISNSGQIAGYYPDTSGVYHGFVLKN